MKILEMELALARYINIRQNLVVPNVYWGFTEHECDLLVLTKAGYLWEIEIKTSKADLLQDQKKRHGYRSDKIKFLYFAIPEKLLKHKALIPERAGIITLKMEKTVYKPYLYCYPERAPLLNVNYKVTEEERFQIARLGAMRIWGLKAKLLKTMEEVE